jgi:hypothetical protein
MLGVAAGVTKGRLKPAEIAPKIADLAGKSCRRSEACARLQTPLKVRPASTPKKRRPREEGVKSLRQVSYRQETYRAVQPLYKINALSPSQKSCCAPSRAWFRVGRVNSISGCDANDTHA